MVSEVNWMTSEWSFRFPASSALDVNVAWFSGRIVPG